MIDAEKAIYDRIITQLRKREDLPDFSHSGEPTLSPAAFPFICVMEMDNSTDRASRTTGGGEVYAVLTYEVTTFSNKINGKKQECRKLAGAVDDIMLDMNFRRISLKPVPNLLSGSVYRMVGRYEVMIDAEGRLFYRR